MRSSVSSRSVPSGFMKIGAWNISPTFSSSVMRASSSSTRSSMAAVLIGADPLTQLRLEQHYAPTTGVE